MRPSGRNASRHGSLKVITVVMVKGTLASGFCSPILKCAQGAADAAVRRNTALTNFIVTFSVAFPEEADFRHPGRYCRSYTAVRIVPNQHTIERRGYNRVVPEINNVVAAATSTPKLQDGVIAATDIDP